MIIKRKCNLTMSLDIKNLKLGYEEKIIINDITISIPKGKITMLIGANGCGKSTLLHGMSRLLKPISGEVSLNGVSVHEYKPKEYVAKSKSTFKNEAMKLAIDAKYILKCLDNPIIQSTIVGTIGLQ